MTLAHIGKKKIIQQGNSVGVTLSPLLLSVLSIKQGDYVNLMFDKDKNELIMKKEDD